MALMRKGTSAATGIANRANALKSTGRGRGQSISRLNSAKHWGRAETIRPKFDRVLEVLRSRGSADLSFNPSIRQGCPECRRRARSAAFPSDNFELCFSNSVYGSRRVGVGTVRAFLTVGFSLGGSVWTAHGWKRTNRGYYSSLVPTGSTDRQYRPAVPAGPPQLDRFRCNP